MTCEEKRRIKLLRIFRKSITFYYKTSFYASHPSPLQRSGCLTVLSGERRFGKKQNRVNDAEAGIGNCKPLFGDCKP